MGVGFGTRRFNVVGRILGPVITLPSNTLPQLLYLIDMLIQLPRQLDFLLLVLFGLGVQVVIVSGGGGHPLIILIQLANRLRQILLLQRRGVLLRYEVRLLLFAQFADLRDLGDYERRLSVDFLFFTFGGIC